MITSILSRIILMIKKEKVYRNMKISLVIQILKINLEIVIKNKLTKKIQLFKAELVVFLNNCNKQKLI